MYQTKKMRRQKTQNDEHLSLEMVIKISEIRPKRWGRLWWEGFIEKVSFESGVELRWSDASWKWWWRWWWWTGEKTMRWQWQRLVINRLVTFFRKFIPETRWGMAERAVVDFQRGRWTSKCDNIRGTSVAKRRDKIMER